MNDAENERTNEPVVAQIEDSVATIVLNRPDKLNAMNIELLQSLLWALREAARNEAVGVVIITGSGRAFSAGGDLDEGDEAWGGPFSEDVLKLRELMEASELLVEMPKVTIAAINGPCAGGALALACAADLRYSAKSAVFTTAFAKVGLTGDYGGTWTLPRVVGPAKARELYLLPERFDAKEALRIGLVSQVLADNDLMSHTRSIANQLAAVPSGVISGIKKNLNDGLRLPLSQLLDREAERQVRAARAPERSGIDSNRHQK